MWPNRDVSGALARELNANFISGLVCKCGAVAESGERERNAYLWVGRFCLHHAGWVTCVLSGSMAGASRIGAASAACTWRGRGLIAPSITSQLPANTHTNTTHTMLLFFHFHICSGGGAARALAYFSPFPIDPRRAENALCKFIICAPRCSPPALHAILKFIFLALSAWLWWMRCSAAAHDDNSKFSQMMGKKLVSRGGNHRSLEELMQPAGQTRTEIA